MTTIESEVVPKANSDFGQITPERFASEWLKLGKKSTVMQLSNDKLTGETVFAFPDLLAIGRSAGVSVGVMQQMLDDSNNRANVLTSIESGLQVSVVVDEIRPSAEPKHSEPVTVVREAGSKVTLESGMVLVHRDIPRMRLVIGGLIFDKRASPDGMTVITHVKFKYIDCNNNNKEFNLEMPFEQVKKYFLAEITAYQEIT